MNVCTVAVTYAVNKGEWCVWGYFGEVKSSAYWWIPHGATFWSQGFLWMYEVISPWVCTGVLGE